MQDDISISVRNLGKKYHLYNANYHIVKEMLSPFRTSYHTDYWALRNLSFDVRKGQTVGILGPNGSGKSSLLKLISSILQPSEGSITANGVVSGILELGAGFNPDFTGRDNAILNASILGLNTREIEQRLPEIIKFADIGEYFDRPVKFYSSGMFVRLAFSVAINVDPDILVIDEALAVGDIRFQNKCFQRFSSFQDAGKTILFVTHSPDMVAKHCHRVLVLNRGKLVFDGSPAKGIDKYIRLSFSQPLPQNESSDRRLADSKIEAVNQKHTQISENILKELNQEPEVADFKTRPSYNVNYTQYGDQRAKIIDFFITNEDGIDVQSVSFNTQVDVYLRVKFLEDYNFRPIAGYSVRSIDGLEIFGTNTFIMGVELQPANKEDCRWYRFSFLAKLPAGDYFLDLGIADQNGTQAGQPLDVCRFVCHLFVKPGNSDFKGLCYLDEKFLELGECRKQLSE